MGPWRQPDDIPNNAQQVPAAYDDIEGWGLLLKIFSTKSGVESIGGDWWPASAYAHIWTTKPRDPCIPDQQIVSPAPDRYPVRC